MSRATHRRRGRIALLAAAAAAALAVVPATAQADLTVYGGTIPSGAAVPAGPWSGINYGSISGGAFGVSMPGFVGPGWSQTASLGAPAGLSFSSVTAVRYFDAPVSFNTSQPRISTTWENRGWWGGGYGGDAGSGAIAVSSPGSLSITVICDMNYYNPPNNCSGGGYWYASRMSYVLRDSADPTGTLTNGGGALLDGKWKTTSTAALELIAGDTGAGLYRAFFREGGTTHYVVTDANGGRCADVNTANGDPFEFAAGTTSLVPCRTASQAYAVSFDLAAIGDGEHKGSIGIQDASGRETILATNQTIRINAPDGDLPDEGSACENGTHDASGTCITRPPVNTSIPALAGTATPTQGESLTTDNGAWNDIENASWSYGWEACDTDGTGCAELDTAPSGCGGSCTVSTGADTATLTLGHDVVGKRLRSVVTVTTNGGTQTAQSALSATIAPMVPVNTVRPALSGIVQGGETLQTTRGTWTNLVNGGAEGAATSTQHVERCDAAGNDCRTIDTWPLGGYELTTGDVGHTIRARVVMTNIGGGQATAYSSLSPIVYPAAGSGSGSGTGGSGSVRTVQPIILPPAGGGGGGGPRDESQNPTLPVPAAPAGYDRVSPNGQNADQAVNLTAGTAAGDRAIPFGRSVILEGRLVAKNGKPIVDAQIDVVSHLAMAGARATVDGAVKTDSDGRFRYLLPAGPSRIVTFGYRLRLSDQFYTDHSSVLVKVTPKVTLSTSAKRLANGKAVRLSGRVAGAPAGARKLVELQVRKGKRWQTFATTRLTGQKFAHSYTFDRTRQTTTYRLRALVKADPTWPLQTGQSSARKVKVIR